MLNPETKPFFIAYLFVFMILLFGCAKPFSAKFEGNETDTLQNAADKHVSNSDDTLEDTLEKSEKWIGKSKGFIISQDEGDLVVTKDKKVVFAAQKLSAERIVKDYRSSLGIYPDIFYAYSLKSIVGSYLSFEQERANTPQTFLYKRFITIDMVHPDTKAKLTDCFGEKDILNALLNTSLVQYDLRDYEIVFGKPVYPKSLDDFFDIFSYALSGDEVLNNRDCRLCGFTPNLLENFYFNRIEGDKVIVTIGITWLEGMREKTKYPIELSLPIPGKLKEDLRFAAARKSGILYKDIKKQLGDLVTVISFDEKQQRKVARQNGIKLDKKQ